MEPQASNPSSIVQQPSDGQTCSGQNWQLPADFSRHCLSQLNELKLLRQEGRCPATELKQEKHQRAIEAEQVEDPELTVQGLVELYLTGRIEDRKTRDGKIIPGARKPKGPDL